MKSQSFTSSLVGADIQRQSLHLVKLRKWRQAFVLEQAISASLPANVFAADRVQGWAVFGEILSSLVNKHHLQGATAAINLPANLVRLQHMQMPLGISEVAIEADIQAQMARDFPGVREAFVMDYRVTPHKQAGYAIVHFAVSRQTYLTQLIEAIQQAGLKVRIVDIDIYALKRVLDFAMPLSNLPDVVTGILWHNANTAFLVMQENDDIIFHQQWEFSDLTDCMQQLKSKIQHFQATHTARRIQQWRVCPLLKDSIMTLDPSADVYFPKPLAKFKGIAETQDMNPWVMACGAAMREKPKW